MSNPIFIAATTMLIWAGSNLLGYESEAMKVCELSHSHDVCFQTLNR